MPDASTFRPNDRHFSKLKPRPDFCPNPGEAKAQTRFETGEIMRLLIAPFPVLPGGTPAAIHIEPITGELVRVGTA